MENTSSWIREQSKKIEDNSDQKDFSEVTQEIQDLSIQGNDKITEV